VAVTAALLLVEVEYSGLIPLLPTFQTRLDLNAFWTGALLALPPLSLALTAAPMAGLVHRLGARRVIVAGGVLGAALTVVLPLLPTAPLVMLDRLGLGVAQAAVWVAGAHLLSQLEVRNPTRAGVSAMMIATAAGVAIGPAFMGGLASLAGFAAPFLAVGALALVCVAALVVVAVDQDGEVEATPGHLEGFRAAASDAGMVLATGGLVLSAFLGTGTSVLAALDLRRAGLSEADIGSLITVGVLVFLGASAAVGGSKARVVPTRVLLIAIALMPLALSLAAYDVTVLTIALTLVLSGLTRGFVATSALPYSDRAARSACIPVATASAFVLMIWSSAAVVGPLVGGVLVDVAHGAAWAYMELLGLLVLATVAIYARRLSVRSEARSSPPPDCLVTR
jgi:YNFM family putative membrane transporter